MENKSINLLFDRTFFTEENYCRLGKKQYTFTDVYTNLLEEFSKLDFEIYYITLYLKDENLYNERLKREGKAVFQGSNFAAENSIKQQREYLVMAEEIKEKYPHIKRIYVRSAFQHIPDWYEDSLLEHYEDTYFPEHMDKAEKASYVERNQEMINKSDFCIVYYDENYAPPRRKKQQTRFIGLST
jgi:hypothetical protein